MRTIDAVKLEGLLTADCGAFAFRRQNESYFNLLCFCSGDVDTDINAYLWNK